jgi:hypothetical protein
MSRRAQENVIALVLLAFFVGIFVMSFDYGPRARLVPLPIAALGIALVLAQLVWQNVRSLDELQVDMLEFISGEQAPPQAGLGSEDNSTKERPPGGINREAAAFGIVAVLLALCFVLGPLIGVFAFMAGYFALSRLSSWPMAIVFAFAGSTAFYFLFGALLNVQFNRGLLAPVISPYLHF